MPTVGPDAGARTTKKSGSSGAGCPSGAGSFAEPIHAPTHFASSGARSAGFASAGVAAGGGAPIPRRAGASCPGAPTATEPNPATTSVATSREASGPSVKERNDMWGLRGGS